MTKKADPTRKGASASEHEDDDQIQQPNTLDKRQEAMQRAIDGRKAEIENPPEAVTHPDVYVENEPESTLEIEKSNPNDTIDPDGADKTVAPQENLGDDGNKLETKPGAEPPIFDKDGVPYMRLKVEGKLMEMPVDKVIGIAQKNLTADNRLRSATEKLREAEQLAESLKDQQAKLKSSLTQPPQSKGVEVNDEQIEGFSKDFINALFRGTQEEAIEKFTKFQKDLLVKGQPMMDIDDLMARVSETAEQRATAAYEARVKQDRAAAEEADIQKGYSQLQQQYPELLTDDLLFGALDRRTEDLRVLHPELSPSQIMLQAAKEVSERFKTPTATPTPATPINKQVRKDALKPVPTPRSGVARPSAEPRGPKTPQQIAEEMKQRRAALSGRA
jgi:hypothetical protein